MPRKTRSSRIKEISHHDDIQNIINRKKSKNTLVTKQLSDQEMLDLGIDPKKVKKYRLNKILDPVADFRKKALLRRNRKSYFNSGKVGYLKKFI